MMALTLSAAMVIATALAYVHGHASGIRQVGAELAAIENAVPRPLDT